MTRRGLFAVLALLMIALGGCASPAVDLSDRDIAALLDDQLCSFNNNYRSEARTKAEIVRRGLNCDRHYRECLRRGNQPGTEAMDFCVDILRQNERLRYDPPDRFNIFGYSDYDRIRRVTTP